jgi:hypothetical protein
MTLTSRFHFLISFVSLRSLSTTVQTYGNQFVYPAGAPTVIVAEAMIAAYKKQAEAQLDPEDDDTKSGSAQSSGAASGAASTESSAALLQLSEHLQSVGASNPVEHAARIAYNALHLEAAARAADAKASAAAAVAAAAKGATRGTKRSRNEVESTFVPPATAAQLNSTITEESVASIWLRAIGGGKNTTRPFLKRTRQDPASRSVSRFPVCLI